ncbi:MAG: MASE1 domain-containing protein [Gallionella sp.]|nr:MASE1 domain-containing protein [Gallionella sp.]
MPYPDTRRRLTDLLKQFGVAALYALLIFLDHRYFENGTTVTSPFEPASGFALAVLLIGGKRYALGVLLGAILINVLRAPFWEAAIISSGEALEAFCGAWLLTRNSRFNLAIQSLRDYLRLILMGGVIGAGIGAHTVTTALLVSGFIAPETFSSELIHWWSGDLLGVILVAPLILVCWQTKNDWHGAKRVTEAVLLLGLTFLAGQIIFLGWLHTTDGLFEQVAKGYWIFLCMVWVAARLGTRGAVIAMNMAAIQGLLGAYHGVGFFADDIALTQLVNYWFFMLTLSVVGMALAIFINEHKRAEETLQRSEMKFRALYDSIGDAVHLMDETGFIDCNKATLAMCGCATKEEFCSKSPVDFSPPEQPCGTNSLILTNRYIATAMEKGSHRFDWVCRRFDNGKLFNIDVQITTMELDGKPVFLVVARDITERRRAEKALRESEERLWSIMNNASAVIFLKDTAGRYLLVNSRFEKLFHLSNAAIQGKTDHDIFPQSIADALIEADRKAIHARQSIEVEERVMQDDGIHTYISVKFPLRNTSGETYAVCGISTDITERKAAEQRLHDLSTHILEVREEEKARIAREIHDELGGTLTALKIDTHWLLRKLPVNEETTAFIERAKSISQRIDSAVSATRHIIDNMRPTILDDLGLLAAIEWQVAEFCKNTGVECRVNCTEDEANLDKQRSIALFRILQESLTNVSRHSGASRVEVEFLHSENEVVLTVCDNGCGIPENHTAASKSYGMLGMTERIGQLGGKITFSRPPDGGFCVEAFLPLPADNKGEKT